MQSLLQEQGTSRHQNPIQGTGPACQHSSRGLQGRDRVCQMDECARVPDPPFCKNGCPEEQSANSERRRQAAGRTSCCKEAARVWSTHRSSVHAKLQRRALPRQGPRGGRTPEHRGVGRGQESKLGTDNVGGNPLCQRKGNLQRPAVSSSSAGVSAAALKMAGGQARVAGAYPSTPVFAQPPQTEVPGPWLHM